MKRKKNEDYEEIQIITMYMFSFKFYYVQKYNLNKSCLYLNIHKYTNYNIIEIYINRLSTTTQIFIVMDYLIMMSREVTYFRKRTKHLVRKFLTHPIEVTGSMYFGNIFQIIRLPKICTKT